MGIVAIGPGNSGIGSAWLLSRRNTVDVYEAEPGLGGHTHTVDVIADRAQQRAPCGGQGAEGKRESHRRGMPAVAQGD